MENFDLVEEWEKRMFLSDEMWNLSISILEFEECDDGAYKVCCELKVYEDTFLLNLCLEKLVNCNDCLIKIFHLKHHSGTMFLGRNLEPWLKELEKDVEFESMVQGLEELGHLLEQQRKILHFMESNFQCFCSSELKENVLFINYKISEERVMSAEWKIIWNPAIQTFAHNIEILIDLPGRRIPPQVKRIIKQLMLHPEAQKWWASLFQEIHEFFNLWMAI